MKTNKSILLIKSAIIAFVLTTLYSVIPFQAVCAEIPNNVFRFHILANSDTEEDQTLKLKVRDKVLEERQFKDTITSETIEEIAQNEVYKNGYNYPVKAEIVNMHFDTRHYESYTLPAGMYDALRITIGNAKGHNWWCVMYPSICISTADEGKDRAKDVLSDDEYSLVTDDKVEYKFFIVELFQKIFV